MEGDAPKDEVLDAIEAEVRRRTANAPHLEAHELLTLAQTQVVIQKGRQRAQHPAPFDGNAVWQVLSEKLGPVLEVLAQKALATSAPTLPTAPKATT